MATRQCAYCGTFVSETTQQCPNCKEYIPEKIELRKAHTEGGPQIRRGLLYMLMAAVLYHFLSPERSLPLPIELHIPEFVTSYAIPGLFLLGLGHTLLGGARKIGLWT